jgi:hypothetical protein
MGTRNSSHADLVAPVNLFFDPRIQIGQLNLTRQTNSACVPHLHRWQPFAMLLLLEYTIYPLPTPFHNSLIRWTSRTPIQPLHPGANFSRQFSYSYSQQRKWDKC